MSMNNVTNITLQDINRIINVSSGDPIEFMININTIAFNGWFYFILLIILGIILFRKAQEKQDQPVVNIMYVSTALTILSFIMRALFMIKSGVYYGLITDFQLWIFPLIAAISAAIAKFSNPS